MISNFLKLLPGLRRFTPDNRRCRYQEIKFSEGRLFPTTLAGSDKKATGMSSSIPIAFYLSTGITVGSQSSNLVFLIFKHLSSCKHLLIFFIKGDKLACSQGCR